MVAKRYKPWGKTPGYFKIIKQDKTNMKNKSLLKQRFNEMAKVAVLIGGSVISSISLMLASGFLFDKMHLSCKSSKVEKDVNHKDTVCAKVSMIQGKAMIR
jgi:hypothetical protein